MTVVFAAACGTVTVAAGCGGSAAAAACGPGGSAGSGGTAIAGGAPRHLSVVGSAAVRTERAGSARMVMRTSGPSSVSLAMTGATDFVHQRGRMQFSGDLNGTDFSTEIRLVGHCEYIRAAGELSLPTKKTWASIDIDRLLPGLGGSSPTSANDSLKELEQTGTFHRIGPARVRGVETTLYDGRVVAAKVSAKLPKRYGEVLKKEHVTSIPTRVWIDRSGYLRRMTESVNGELVTIELYDFGVPVHVKAPPLDQVQDVTSNVTSELGA